MGKRGPAPKPTAQKILEGNPGHRPINKKEPQPAIPKRKPRAPRHLRYGGRKEWDRVAKAIFDAGALTEVDRALLAAYCHSSFRYLEADHEIDETGGQVITRPTGVMVINPHVKAAQSWLDYVIKIGNRFGLTPADRSRLVIGDDGVEKTETFDEILNQLFIPVNED